MDFTGLSFDWTQTGRKTELNVHGNESTATATASVRSCTAKQIEIYNEQCTKKGLTPEDWTGWTYDQMYQEINRIRNFYPASEPQKKLIREKQTLLKDLMASAGKEFTPMSESDIQKLTGGKNGSASALIETLINEERKYTEFLKPSDEQIKLMVTMFYCPDAAFEDFGIERKVWLNEFIGDKQKWRLKDAGEFGQDIYNTMSRRMASEFIDKHRGVFTIWKRSRIRPEQVRHIRRLEARMGTILKPRVVEFAVVDGEVQQIVNHNIDRTQSYDPTAYQGYSDVALNQMSQEQADWYINQLEAELHDKDLTSYGESADGSQTLEVLRVANNKEAWFQQEFKALNDLMYSLMASAGYPIEEFQDEAVKLIVDKWEERDRLQNVKDKIEAVHEYMMYLVDEELIGFDGLAKLCENSEIGKAIMMGRF